MVIDIDHLPKESIKALIADFDIKTMTVWTERGVHLYFKKPADFARAKDGVCRLGFAIEQHTSRTRPNGMTIKKNGQLRQIDNENVRQYMPPCFKLGTMKHPYKDMTGMDEGDAEEARRLYTAHKLTIYSMTVPPVSPAPGEPLSPAVIASAGKAQSAQQVASKKVGEVAVTYATSSHLSGNISTTLADLPETAYGIQLLTLLRQYSRPRYIP